MCFWGQVERVLTCVTNALNFPMEIWLPLLRQFWFSHGIKYKLIKNRTKSIPFISTNDVLI